MVSAFYGLTSGSKLLRKSSCSSGQTRARWKLWTPSPKRNKMTKMLAHMEEGCLQYLAPSQAMDLRFQVTLECRLGPGLASLIGALLPRIPHSDGSLTKTGTFPLHHLGLGPALRTLWTSSGLSLSRGGFHAHLKPLAILKAWHCTASSAGCAPMAGDHLKNGEALEHTPTYCVATAAALIILISLLLEDSIQKHLKRTRIKPVRQVMDKMIHELLLLGFASWLLEVFHRPISKLCVPEKFARHMLPCKPDHQLRRLLSMPDRELSEAIVAAQHDSLCAAQGKVSLIPSEGLHQLHFFIFVLAILHIFYSLLLVVLGFSKVHSWKAWEDEARCADYCGRKDLEMRYIKRSKAPGSTRRWYFTHEQAESPVCVWIKCFVRQFFVPVSREDYLTLRAGFVHNHNLGDAFHFRDYVVGCMGTEFKEVIAISWWLWLFVVLLLLLDVHGWNTYMWAAFLPALLVLTVGTKQQHVLATLTLQAKRHALSVAEAGNDINLDPEIAIDKKEITTAIKPSDNLFWFNRPKLLLALLRISMFQNSFELATIVWIRISFGSRACIWGQPQFLYIRMAIGVFTQLLSSYSTLPTYALVTQMASSLKTPDDALTAETVYYGLLGWRERALKAEREAAQLTTDGGRLKTDDRHFTDNILPSPAEREEIGRRTLEK